MRSILNSSHYMRDYDIGPDWPTHPPEYDDESYDDDYEELGDESID